MTVPLIVNLKDWPLVLSAGPCWRESCEQLERKVFFHTNKCKCMSLNVKMELLIYGGNGHVFSCSISNSDLF